MIESGNVASEMLRESEELIDLGEASRETRGSYGGPYPEQGVFPFAFG